jgi:hypothetical protein
MMPQRISPPALQRQLLVGSQKMKVPMSMANNTLVSLKAATSATGARVKAQTAIQ